MNDKQKLEILSVVIVNDHRVINIVSIDTMECVCKYCGHTKQVKFKDVVTLTPEENLHYKIDHEESCPVLIAEQVIGDMKEGV